jgi:hypothetical protein
MQAVRQMASSARVMSPALASAVSSAASVRKLPALAQFVRSMHVKKYEGQKEVKNFTMVRVGVLYPLVVWAILLHEFSCEF